MAFLKFLLTSVVFCYNNFLYVGGVSVSDVINSRLETVVIPRRFRFRSSSLRRVYVDYYFFDGLRAGGSLRMGVQTGRYFLTYVTTSLDMESYATGYLMPAKEDSEVVYMEFLCPHTQSRCFGHVAHWCGQGCSYLADWIEFLSSTYQFKLDERKMLFMSKLTARTAVLWVITGLVIGSVFASFSDLVRQNTWFIVYEGLVGAWLFVLTGIASIHLAEKK